MFYDELGKRDTAVSTGQTSKAAAGHRAREKTEHYTHFNLNDFEDVLVIQNKYFS